MDVSLLALATAGVFPDETAMLQSGVAAPADGFAKLLAGLGTEAAPTDKGLVTIDAAAPDADSLMSPPIDPALLLAAKPVVAGGKGVNVEAERDSSEPGPEEADPSAPDTPTATSLGLPPLLAALVAPTLSQASAQPAVAAENGSAQPVIAASPEPVLGKSPAANPQLPFDIAKSAASHGVAGASQDSAAATGPNASVPQAGLAVSQPLQAQLGQPAAERAAVDGAPVKLAAKPVAPNGQTAPAAEAAAPVVTARDAAPPRRPVPSLDHRPTSPAPAGVTRKSAIEPAPAVVKATQPGPATTVAPLLDMALPSPAPTVEAASDVAPSPADVAVEQQLDLARDGEWLDQLAKDIVRTAATEGSLRFKLNPENLGSLHVEVTQGQAGASVRLTADTEQARAIIADAKPQLVAEARAQGVRIAEAHVDLGGQGSAQAHSQAGSGSRHHRDAPAQEYLTSWKPESAEEEATPRRRPTAERYA